MFLFNKRERESLREKAKHKPYIFDLLAEDAEYPHTAELIVPKISKSDWGMYYNCPKDSARLKFDRREPHRHICPVCGEIYTGEPYDGCWQSCIHNANAQEALRCGYLYLLTEEEGYASKAGRILKEYALYYPNYQAHGNIPYNGPGLAFAQTLDEAVFLRKMAYAFDLISETLEENEAETVLCRLFRIGADFLSEHRTEQIHNHEVLINSAIGILGLLIGDEKILYEALYAPFGLNDQRRQGVLADDFWFEGTLSYHQYALEAFFSYEIFARHTQYSNLGDEQFLRMLKKPDDLLMPNNVTPALNDSRCLGHKFGADTAIEFGYNYYRDAELGELLSLCYQDQKRESIDAFFYGADDLPPAPVRQRRNYHSAGGSGLTVIRGTQDRYLLIKHSPFGGEHDHYDRLGISFSAFGDQMCSDLGTVSYGVPWHYDYYKNTCSHNTIAVNEKNQPPQSCRVLDYREKADSVFIDCCVEWGGRYDMPPTFVIKQWDDAEYEGTFYRRQILWKDDYFVDVVKVLHPEQRCTDWILHVDGGQEDKTPEAETDGFGKEKPFCFLSDVRCLRYDKLHTRIWKTPHGYLRLFSCGEGTDIYTAKGPNVPPQNTLCYVIERQKSKECIFVNVFETYRDKPFLKSVNVRKDGDFVTVNIDGEDMNFSLK